MSLVSVSRTSVCLIMVCCVCMCVELRQQEETGQLVQPVLFVLLVLGSVLLYFAVSLMDPGFILSEDRDLQVLYDPHMYLHPHSLSISSERSSCFDWESQ